MRKREGRVYCRCGCADPATGRPASAGCPRLARRGHGSWYVALELPPDPDGRRRRIRRGGYPTRQIARQALAQLSTPGPAGGTAMTTGQWLGRWLACRWQPALLPSATGASFCSRGREADSDRSTLVTDSGKGHGRRRS